MKTPDEIKKGLSCCEKMDKDDAISREYCLDTIAKLPLNWEYGLGVEDCYKIVENAPSVDCQVLKWISVEDRKPEGVVLVANFAPGTDGYKKMDVADVFDAGNSDITFYLLNGFDVEYNVTHWMPIPDVPPEKG